MILRKSFQGTMYCNNCGKEVSKDNQFCIYCGQDTTDNQERFSNVGSISKTKSKKPNKGLLIVIGVIIVLIGAIVLVNNWVSKESQSNTPPEENIDNARAVVQILCDNEFSGSGTMFSEEGIVVTNNHVLEDADYCLITIPNPTTGEPEEIYEAQPIFIPKLSKEYDIAMLMVTEVFKDEDGTVWGEYPTVFTAFQSPSSCSDTPSKLGDSVKIYGYPSTSHNYNLTVTDGIISNFDSGYILTSAKVDSGNSGGMAIDQYGCFIGIPSAVLMGDYQNLGVIIPSSIVLEFINASKSEDISLESNGNTSVAKQNDKNTTSPTTDPNPKIECVGPDGVHFKTTQKECDDFNNAWNKPKPTPAPRPTDQNSTCGENQHESYGYCSCNDGYSKNYSTGKCEPCPPNSSGSYGVCSCNDGYSKNYSTGQCEPCPENSTWSYGYCSCNSGYSKDYSSGQCIKNLN